MSTTLAPSASVELRDKTAGRFYFPELDALRFFAFFGVFVFHVAPRTPAFYAAAHWPEWLSTPLIAIFGAGAYGVDLFFALSAYLITSLLLRETEALGRLDLRRFYIRRILRIWPLYLTFLAVAAVAPYFMEGQHLPWQYLAGFACLAGNWIYVFHGLPASFAVPLWTVSIEEQFYLLWPLALRRASRYSVAALAVALLVIANALRVLLALTGAPADAMEYATFTRLDPIALGALLALFHDRLPQFTRMQRLLLLLSGTMTWVLVYGVTSMHPSNVSNWGSVLGHPLNAIASLAVLMAVLDSTSTFLRNVTLVYLGKISYGLYVVHELAHECAKRLVHASTPAQVLLQSIVALGLTLLIGLGSYRWLEAPFLRLKERFAYVQSRPV